MIKRVTLALLSMAFVLLVTSCDDQQTAMLLEDLLKDGQSYHPSPQPTVKITWWSNSLFKACVVDGEYEADAGRDAIGFEELK